MTYCSVKIIGSQIYCDWQFGLCTYLLSTFPISLYLLCEIIFSNKYTVRWIDFGRTKQNKNKDTYIVLALKCMVDTALAVGIFCSLFEFVRRLSNAYQDLGWLLYPQLAHTTTSFIACSQLFILRFWKWSEFNGISYKTMLGLIIGESQIRQLNIPHEIQNVVPSSTVIFILLAPLIK